MKMTEDLDEFLFLTKKEFEKLKDNSKWNYIEGLLKILKDTKIMADKNCDDCIYRLQTTSDVNIELFFEDWRNCSDNCDECGIEQLKEMCQVQFELMSHIANSLINIQNRQNMLVKFIYRKDESGKEILKKMLKDSKKKTLTTYS